MRILSQLPSLSEDTNVNFFDSEMVGGEEHTHKGKAQFS